MPSGVTPVPPLRRHLGSSVPAPQKSHPLQKLEEPRHPFELSSWAGSWGITVLGPPGLRAHKEPTLWAASLSSETTPALQMLRHPWFSVPLPWTQDNSALGVSWGHEGPRGGCPRAALSSWGCVGPAPHRVMWAFGKLSQNESILILITLMVLPPHITLLRPPDSHINGGVSSLIWRHLAKSLVRSEPTDSKQFSTLSP